MANYSHRSTGERVQVVVLDALGPLGSVKSVISELSSLAKGLLALIAAVTTKSCLPGVINARLADEDWGATSAVLDLQIKSCVASPEAGGVSGEYSGQAGEVKGQCRSDKASRAQC